MKMKPKPKLVYIGTKEGGTVLKFRYGSATYLYRIDKALASKIDSIAKHSPAVGIGMAKKHGRLLNDV
jgi:hypothetical protein